MLLNCGVREDSWESLGLQGEPTSPSWRKSALNIHCDDWCWSWSSNTLATWCEELTQWKRPWCWERLKAGGEGDDRGWDGWMASRLDGWGFEQTPGVGDGIREAWCAAVHEVAKSWKWLSNWTELVPAHLWIEEINTPLPNADLEMLYDSFCFPTVSLSLFCLLTLVPHCFFLSDL